jgi:hypothetical protein
MDIGENLEIIGTTHIVPIARHPVGNHFLAVGIRLSHLGPLKRLNHAVFSGHTGNPLVGLDAHTVMLSNKMSGALGGLANNHIKIRCCMPGVPESGP